MNVEVKLGDRSRVCELHGARCDGDFTAHIEADVGDSWICEDCVRDVLGGAAARALGRPVCSTCGETTMAARLGDRGGWVCESCAGRLREAVKRLVGEVI